MTKRESGYVSCECRDCFEVTIGHVTCRGHMVGFCAECVEAGCPDYQGQKGMSQDCQRQDAYASEEV